MIKSIKSQNPTRIIVTKDNIIIADLHMSSIEGGIDIDKIKCITNEQYGIFTVRLEV